MAADRNRTRRNVLFVLVLLALTAVLAADRLGPLLGADAADEAPTEEAPIGATPTGAGTEPSVTGEAAPSEAPPAAEPPPLAALSFQAYAERYEAVRDSFRARDQLLEEVVGRRVVWEGVLRNVSKQPRAFYVSVAPRDSYGPVSALITFPHAYEDTLYAFRRDDRVRFEGVVERAGASVSIAGAAIARIGRVEPE